MSKSLGNFFTIREIFQKSEWSEEVTGEILRYFLLSTHYHGPLDFSDQALREAKNALNGFYDLFNRLNERGSSGMGDHDLLKTAIEETRKSFIDAMDDDFNTPASIAALQGLRSEVNKMLDKGLSTEARKAVRHEFRSIGMVLGLFQSEEWQYNPPLKIAAFEEVRVSESLSMGIGEAATVLKRERLPDVEIEAKIAERAEAKKKKDFDRADEIRRELKKQGITIEDKPDGTSRWKR
jgi:cysteinyl-tRNA synthetase